MLEDCEGIGGRRGESQKDIILYVDLCILSSH